MMQKRPVTFGAIVGGLTSFPLIALFFLGGRLADLPFVPFDLFDWLARTLPGDVITLAIDTMVRSIQIFGFGPTSEVAKTAEQLSALAMVVAGGAALGAIVAWIADRGSRPSDFVGLAVGVVAFATVIGIELNLGLTALSGLALLWIALLMVGWGWLIGWSLGVSEAPLESAQYQADRRDALTKIAAGSAVMTLGALGLGRALGVEQKETGAGQALTNLLTPSPEPTATPQPSATPTAAGTAAASPEAASPEPSATAPAEPTPTATATMRERVAAAPGTRPEVTPNEDFYRIDINTRPVVIEGKSWVLEVEGLFDNPRPLTLEDLMAYPPVTQPVTMSCISNSIGGDLIGTSNWTGVRLRDLLKDLGMRPEAEELFVEAADGFYESVSMEDLMDPRTLLVYGMNGETLPVEHGFPLRIYIPNRYGMKQPKWITRVEAIDHQGAGYWVDRGWDEEARPKIISMIDTVATDQPVDGKVPVGGIAWAGDRGIQKVEVQVDDGQWHEATLRTPPLSGLTWIQWRYDWPQESGRHTFRVRAVDGTGALQVETRSRSHPDGATGYHSVTMSV